MQEYSEIEFQRRIETTLISIKEILHSTKTPVLAEDVSHVYDDKYLLAEILTNTALAAQLICLKKIGLDNSQLSELLKIARQESVTLRMKINESCCFLEKFDETIESPIVSVTKKLKTVGIFNSDESKTTTKKLSITVTKYRWTFTVTYEIYVFSLLNSDQGSTLFHGTGVHKMVTTTETSPKPQNSIKDNIDVSLNWLLSHINNGLQPNFKIDRQKNNCHTPRRNEDIEEARNYFKCFYTWFSKVDYYFKNQLFPIQSDHNLDLSQIKLGETLVPILPLLHKESSNEESSNLQLPLEQINVLLYQYKQGFENKLQEIDNTFPSNDTLVCAKLAQLLIVMVHGKEISKYFFSSVDYIENLLRKQLIQAIGKEITPEYFTEYMNYHNSKLFNNNYIPSSFNYDIRRPDHYPEGIITIEQGNNEPIKTFTYVSDTPRSMGLRINSTTKIIMNGHHFLHGIVMYQFSGRPIAPLQLIARARQFSCFILMVGKIESDNMFDPKHAIIIKNKDDLKIPLNLEQIPTPKAFKDAIESLSPEQQSFAKAIRTMQLSGSLFGLCVVQIKPQLEKLLNLPEDSLTKEIQLTQDLLKLFIEYQIPSDLISYSGSKKKTDLSVKVKQVTDQVAKMFEMINKEKERELDEDEKRRKFQSSGTSMFGSNLSHLESTQPMMAMSRMATQSVNKNNECFELEEFYEDEECFEECIHSGNTQMNIPKNTNNIDSHVQATSVDIDQEEEEEEEEEEDEDEDEDEEKESIEIFDYTRIPVELDSQIETLDKEGALGATIINVGGDWR